MSRPTTFACAAAIGLDLAAARVLAWGDPSPGLLLVAGALHLGAVAALWFVAVAPRSQRVLLAALAFTLPIVGGMVALAAVRTRRRGEIAEPPPQAEPEAHPLTIADIRRLTDGLSACEALTSAGTTERDATLAMLSRRADAESLCLLRWAVAGHDADLAVDAALALEELSQRPGFAPVGAAGLALAKGG